MHQTTTEDGWPPTYMDPSGVEHSWDDPYPLDDDEDEEEDGRPYTYRDAVTDQAERHDMSVPEFLAWQRGEDGEDVGGEQDEGADGRPYTVVNDEFGIGRRYHDQPGATQYDDGTGTYPIQIWDGA